MLKYECTYQKIQKCMCFGGFVLSFYSIHFSTQGSGFLHQLSSINGSYDIHEVVARHTQCVFLSLRHCNFYQKFPEHYVSRKKNASKLLKILDPIIYVQLKSASVIQSLFLFYPLTKKLFNFASQMFLIFVYFLKILSPHHCLFCGCKQT